MAEKTDRRGTGARRIRSIKPEICESETLGRVSREARLLFVLLWTRADDAGRLEGAPKLLARTLFPWDDDALDFLPGWLDELTREGHVIRYEAGGRRYLAIPEWSKHQRIDRPTPSRLPAPPDHDSSRGLASDPDSSQSLANPREESREPEHDAGKIAPDLDHDHDHDHDHDRERAPSAREDSRGIAKAREESAPVPTRRGALISSGVAWARTHSEHEAGFCGWMCLPSDLVSQFAERLAAARALGGAVSPNDVESARVEVLDWAAEKRREWTAAGRVPTGRFYDWWNARWAEEFGDDAPAGRPDALAGVRAALAAGGRS